MGHYRSELMDDSGKVNGDCWRDRRDESSQSLADRGYTDPVRAVGERSEVEVRGKARMQLRLHSPCGAAVFNPETHDKFCPAMD